MEAESIEVRLPTRLLAELDEEQFSRYWRAWRSGEEIPVAIGESNYPIWVRVIGIRADDTGVVLRLSRL